MSIAGRRAALLALSSRRSAVAGLRLGDGVAPVPAARSPNRRGLAALSESADKKRADGATGKGRKRDGRVADAQAEVPPPGALLSDAGGTLQRGPASTEATEQVPVATSIWGTMASKALESETKPSRGARVVKRTAAKESSAQTATTDADGALGAETRTSAPGAVERAPDAETRTGEPSETKPRSRGRVVKRTAAEESSAQSATTDTESAPDAETRTSAPGAEPSAEGDNGEKRPGRSRAATAKRVAEVESLSLGNAQAGTVGATRGTAEVQGTEVTEQTSRTRAPRAKAVSRTRKTRAQVDAAADATNRSVLETLDVAETEGANWSETRIEVDVERAETPTPVAEVNLHQPNRLDGPDGSGSTELHAAKISPDRTEELVKKLRTEAESRHVLVVVEELSAVLRLLRDHGLNFVVWRQLRRSRLVHLEFSHPGAATEAKAIFCKEDIVCCYSPEDRARKKTPEERLRDFAPSKDVTETIVVYEADPVAVVAALNPSKVAHAPDPAVGMKQLMHVKSAGQTMIDFDTRQAAVATMNALAGQFKAEFCASSDLWYRSVRHLTKVLSTYGVPHKSSQLLVMSDKPNDVWRMCERHKLANDPNFVFRPLFQLGAAYLELGSQKRAAQAKRELSPQFSTHYVRRMPPRKNESEQEPVSHDRTSQISAQDTRDELTPGNQSGLS